ncbi:hypothetical protein I5U05_013645 [Stenotrophomonas maltophilia]|jgi:hypothetical protein|uniref:hypothetical protein n=1 Tax=Stenotrophomonas maltophilia TaxID=40324 RepID=UPI0013123EE3|nr:hypothetical protein [Stenotrophomonas maltophilia]MBC8771027.1 hypothetical protein [Stenotrophomonas maltophilia]MBH1608959.1 hypothetical protein [Stenotrophomonas maltophilia]MBH1725898.1 hypothetical protein [Stenotrophomonas maltophilia]MBH1798880.1 hypothetical protein [Stenotrophomonas maltophilia]MBH1805854.1 hypothetical protein [Stenotrophomonas maltophilia]
MRHLALPFFCVVFLGVALGEAFANGVSSRFGAAFLVAAILWAVIAYIEIRAAWPPFAAAMSRRREQRREGWKPPVRNPGPPAARVCTDDTH